MSKYLWGNSGDCGVDLEFGHPLTLLRAVYACGMEGAPRWVSEVYEQYIAQRGLVGTWTGLHFNLCVAPTLTFCPCISGGWMD